MLTLSAQPAIRSRRPSGLVQDADGEEKLSLDGQEAGGELSLENQDAGGEKLSLDGQEAGGGGGLSLEDQDADGEKAAASSQHDRQAPDRSGLGRFKSVC